jgi:oxygen-independent coproporphyrinogen-3 oxidase
MTSFPRLDRDLLRRLDRPGPRYTSYPTAPQFTNRFGEREFREHVRRSNAEPIPRQLSVYLHIPYCFSPCFYCGCNRVITRETGRGRVYVERLIREIERVAALFDRDRDVVQLHLGGGTPNFLRPAELSELMESLGRHFHFSAHGEQDFSIELDPRYVQPGDVAAYARLGFNRASLGVQDFNPAVQAAVNRVQSVEETLAVVEDCRSSGFRSVNIDLIYGLPKQTLSGFEKTLDTVLGVRPDRLAIYSYAHVPQLFKAQRRIDVADLPNPEQKLALLELAIERLGAASYRHIGMDHFATPQDDLSRAQEEGGLHRNFMGYTTHASCDLIGLGMSAISHIGDSYSQNPRDLAQWEAAIDAGGLPVWRGVEMSLDDRIRADVIQQLMCNGEIDIPVLEHRFDISFASYFESALRRLEPLAREGLVAVEPCRIAVTSRGRLLLRIIGMCFDQYINEPAAAAPTPLYSKAI